MLKKQARQRCADGENALASGAGAGMFFLMAFASISQVHIDMLRRAALPDFPKRIYADGPDFSIYQDLATEFLVDAKPGTDGVKTIMYSHRGVTEKGFTALESHRDQQSQAASGGWVSRIRAWLGRVR
jgi:hypothetical protein